MKKLKKAAKKSRSVRQILKILKLKEAGGNYSQIKKYLQIYKIDIGHIKGKAWNKGLQGIGKPIIPLENILVKNIIKVLEKDSCRVILLVKIRLIFGI